MKTSPISHWYQENLATLIESTGYIRQYLENKLEDKVIQPLPPETILPTSALANLCRLFCLTEFERDILLLCTAVEIDPSLAQLCAKLQGNPQLNYPTLALALSNFPQASWAVLSPQNPLQSWRLMEIGTGVTLTLAPLRINPRILSYLLGEAAFDEQLMVFVHPLPLEQISLASSQEQIVEQLVAIWSELSVSSPTLQLCGGEISAKYAIAKAVSIRLGYNLHMMSADVLTQSPQEIYQISQRWQREALLSNSLLLLDCDDIFPNDVKSAFTFSQFVESLQTPVIISSGERLHTKHNHLITFHVPQLNYQEQARIWSTYLGTAANLLQVEITQLVSQFNLSNATIQAACQQFPLQAAQFPETSHSKLLWNFCRTQARPQIDGLAQRIDTSATWDNLVLPEPQRQVLTDIATHLRQRAKVYQEWGFASKGSRGLGISALFHGESGTGKTMAAEVLANQFGLDLYRIDLSAVVSKYIGETEKNLGRIFAAAETGGVILLFDEADALFGKRTEVQDSHDRHANVEVSYLLQRMESYQGLAILTTNLKNALDSAFLRRIRFMLAFPFPEAPSRNEIWQRIFPAQTPTQGLDYQKLGQLKVAGGNIRNIALNAAFLAADADEPVMMKHILQAAQREYLKLKRLLNDEETRGWI